MTPDRFTVRGTESLQTAQQHAAAAGHAEMSTLHLLDALVQTKTENRAQPGGGIIVPLLEKRRQMIQEWSDYCG